VAPFCKEEKLFAKGEFAPIIDDFCSLFVSGERTTRAGRTQYEHKE
jgi:hypothetical protein